MESPTIDVEEIPGRNLRTKTGGVCFYSVKSSRLCLKLCVTVKVGRFDETSTTPADILQLRGRSGLFRDEGVFVFAWRHINIGFGLPRFWRRKRSVVTGKPRARAFDHAAIRFCCESGLARMHRGRISGEPLRPRGYAGDLHAQHPNTISAFRPKRDARRSRQEAHPIRTTAFGVLRYLL